MRWWPLLLVATPLWAHKFHISYTTSEWNAGSNTLELVMQLFPDDLEAAIGKHTGKKLALSRKNDTAIFEYLRQVCEVRDRQGNELDLVWIGMEMDVHKVWVYLEVHLPAGPAGVTLYQRVFFELFDDQVNSVNVKVGDTKQTLVFQRGSDRKTLVSHR